MSFPFSTYFAFIILFVLCSAGLAPAQTHVHTVVTLSIEAKAVQEARNPDGRVKAGQGQSLPTAPATNLDLHLSMIIFGVSNSIAVINGKTLAQGESAQIPVKGGTLTIKCLQIKKDSVQISVDGDIPRFSKAPAKPAPAAPVWRPPPIVTKPPVREPKIDPIEPERNPARSLLDRILAYHSGSPKNGRKLQVVYFYPSDREPPNDYKGRISRVMLNIQEFYRSQMIRNGFTENNEIPLQMSDGAVVIHPVKGKDVERNYSYGDGGRIYIEIKRALGKLNTTQNPTIIFDYLCCPTGDSHFFFHTPFYGKPGVAWVSDCDCMDPGFLNDTVDRVFSNSTRSRTWEADNETLKKSESTLAEFNGLLIGGAAHELGHAMLLPHDGQTATQVKQLGLSLMGQGNCVYHREQRNPKLKGAFLSLADSLRLAATPLFTQSDRGRNLHGRITNMKLVFGTSASSLKVEGKVESNLEVLALIAYSVPWSATHTNWNSYIATTWVGEVRDGAFSITVGEHMANMDNFDLELAFQFINGTIFTMCVPYHCTPTGTPDAEELNATWRTKEHGYSGNMSVEE
jgi:hypothetical protein